MGACCDDLAEQFDAIDSDLFQTVDKIKLRLIIIVTFHVKLIELVQKCNLFSGVVGCNCWISCRQFKLLTQIFSGVIFYQLACGSAFISTTLFQLDLVSELIDSWIVHKSNALFKAWGNFDGNFFVILCVVVLSIMCILPYCWFASVLSLQLHKVSHDAYHSIWYAHPPHIQKYFKWIISYGQIQRNFEGYHIFRCSLEVFMKVGNTYSQSWSLHINIVIIFRSQKHLVRTI